MLANEAEGEELPFDVEVERRPVWADAASALVIVTALLAAARVLPMAAALPFLLVSSLGGRFGSSAGRVVVTSDGGLELNDKPVDDVRDVWLEDDGVEPRVIVAHGEERALLALWFENRVQAKRFADALPAPRELVAGYRPRRVDLLAPLRFVAIAAAFFALGSWYGGLALVFLPLTLRNYLAAKQLVVQGEAFELRTAHSTETFRRDSVKHVDVDEGVIQLNERELRFATPHSRDVHLTAPLWADALRRRVLKRLSPPAASATPSP